MSQELSAYVWNPYLRAYVPIIGEPVDTTALRANLAEIRGATEARLAQLSEQVVSGELTNLAEFAVEFKKEVKDLYVATHVLVRGGVDSMTPRNWGQLGTAIREQFKFADGFIRDIENNRTKMPVAQRIAMYTESAWGAAGEFENVVRDREMYLGSLERRVLGASEKSCEDCIELAERGWQPPGLMPDIGDTECGPGCNCTYEFENTELDSLARSFGGSTEAKFPASEHPQINRLGTPALPRPKISQLDLFPDLLDNEKSIKGGRGSGNFQHSGRPGLVGGSGSRQDAGPLGLIHGHSATAIIRYMASMMPYSKAQIKVVLNHYGIDINQGTLNTQYNHGRHSRQIPKLTPEQIDELNKIATGSFDAPAALPLVPRPVIPAIPKLPETPAMTIEPQLMHFGQYIAFTSEPPAGSRFTALEFQQKSIRASDKLNRVLDKGLKTYIKTNSVGKSPIEIEALKKNAELYRESFTSAYSRMTDQARINAGRGLNKLEFHTTFEEVRKAGGYGEGSNVAGFHSSWTKTITSDGTSFRDFGKYDWQENHGKFESVLHHHVHELGHAVDARGRKGYNYLSHSNLWLRIWEKEINIPSTPLSQYAKKNRTEGFAEFYRAAVFKPREAKHQFPKAWKFLHKRGLIKD